MFKAIKIWLLSSGLLLAQSPAEPTEAEQQAARAVELRETLRQWVQAETLRSEELAAWETQRAQMQDLLVLQKAELAQLDELLEKAGSSAQSSDEESQSLKAEVARMKAAQAGFVQRLEELRPRLLKLVDAFPKSLRQRVSESSDQLRGLEPAETPREFTQAVVSVLTAAADFNASITVEREIHELEGKRLEVEVLYLGLARGYFMSLDGAVAGVALAGESGWQLQPRPELKGDIQRALAVVTKRERPDFVELPLELTE